MKKSWYGLALAVILLAVVLLGCTFRTSRVELPEAEEPSRKVQVIRAQPKQGEATLYIGMAGQYTMHPYAYEGEATPDQLIAAIAELTGWDLRLDGPILQDSGGIMVTFAADCALFTGPPEPQKEDFFVYSPEELCTTILDSVCHTLQWNIINAKTGDPRTLPVYFRTAAGDLVLEDIGFTQPAGIPYGGLVPDAQVCSAQTRFLGMPSAEEAIFELDGENVSMDIYDEDIAYTAALVTPGLEVSVVYLQSGDVPILTGVY